MLVLRNGELFKTEQKILVEEKKIGEKVVYVPLKEIDLKPVADITSEKWDECKYDHFEWQECAGKTYLKDVDSEGKMQRYACLETGKELDWKKVNIPGNIVLKELNKETYLYDEISGNIYKENGQFLMNFS